MRTRIVLLLVLAFLTLTTGAVAQTPGGSFTDDDGNPHEGYIESIAAEGWTVGCGLQPPRYCPATPVLRNQMAVFLIRVLDEEVNLTSHRGHFADVPPDLWFTAHVERLFDLGITNGCALDPRRFCPERALTRAEMAVLLVQMQGEEAELPTYRGHFADVPPDQWYTAHVERLFDLGITNGCALDPRRFCPDDLVTRDQMATFLGRARGLTAMVPPPRPPVGLLPVASGLDQPLLLTAPPGDPRLFIVEQPGRVRVLDGGIMHDFLDIRGRVLDGGERGLLGLAFHPQYDSNGLFYVNYTDTSGDTVVEEYRVSSDPNSASPSPVRGLLWVDQPFSNHNGGNLVFGADGLLYVGMGDGGGASDPSGLAQDPASRLGKLLRINLQTGAVDVWAAGLRNPWRFTFDDYAGHLYVADVGQSAREEINVAPIQLAGLNYGWSRFEGSLCHNGPCQPQGLIFPAHEYGRGDGCSVIGGHVYRGQDLPHLQGLYFYSDFCGGWLRSFHYDGAAAADHRQWFDLGEPVTSLGLDWRGELYVVTQGGNVYRLAYQP